MWPFTRRSTAPPVETRSTGNGFTADVMAARASYIAGRSGIAELTAAAQSCVSLWEGAFALAAVDGTDLLDGRSMALIGRAMALRGDVVFLIRDDRLVPVGEWDLSTRDGRPTAYRVSIGEAGGGRTETVLAGEILHLRTGCDPSTPYIGSAPLRRASLTAGLLDAVESALAEIFENAPIGSQIVPYPESAETDLEALGRGFRGRRGRVLMRESVSVSTAGGPAPAADWRTADVSPDLQKSMTTQTLAAARDSIAMVFGVLPSMLSAAATGPVIREGQRQLASWTLQPIGKLLAEEASEKLGGDVHVDLMMPLQAFDLSGRARALSTIVEAFARAKEAGMASADFDKAMALVNWGQHDHIA